MITFKNILKEYKIKSRSSLINNEDSTSLSVDNLIYKYTGNKYEDIKNRTSIYRGKLEDRKILFIEPSKFNRKAIGVYNFANIIIDNSKYWVEYPKRSQSIICSTGEQIAGKFAIDGGNLFRVIPKSNAKIVVCKKTDYFYSFKNGLDIFSLMFKEDIARRFNNALKIDIDEFNSFIHFQFSLSDNIRSINTIKQKINHYQFGGQLDENQLHILKYYNCNTLFDFIDYCLNPTLNQIELLEYNDSFHPEVNCEVWTDADSLMIENNYLYDMLMNYY